MTAGRKSRADLAIVEQGESLIKDIKRRMGRDLSLTQVLASDPMLLGRALVLTNLFVDLDYLTVDDPEFLMLITAED